MVRFTLPLNIIALSLVLAASPAWVRADLEDINAQPGDSWSQHNPAGPIHDPAFPVSHLPSRKVTVISENGERSTRESLAGQDIHFWQPKPAKKSTARLRILSYNVHGLPAPIMGNNGRYAEIGRMLAERRKQGTQPDIVALQEAFSNDVQSLIENAGYKHVVWGPLASGGLTMKGGIILMTDLPVIETARAQFTQCYSYDCVAKKGVEFARIQLPNAFLGPQNTPITLDVYNNHLNSNLDGDPVSDPQVPAYARLSQVQEVRDFIQEHSAAWRPILFPGDFNMRPFEYEMVSLTEFLGLSDASDVCARAGNCDPHGADPAKEYQSSVDHQLYRSGTSPEVSITPVRFTRNFAEQYRGKELSDHLGLEIDYEISW